MSKEFPKRPERRHKPSEPGTQPPLFQSQPDPRNDLTGEELRHWLNHQRGVIALLQTMLENETRRLVEVQEMFGMQGERFNAELTYSKIKSIGRLQGAVEDFQTGYQQGWTWKEKIMYIVNYQKYPMKLKDIAKAYRYLDDYADYVDDLNNTISVNLRLLTKSKRLVHYKHPGRRTGSYVHPDWLDGEGRLLSEYNENTTE